LCGAWRTFWNSTRSPTTRRGLLCVCFDEMPYQMVAEKRVPILAKPGCPQRYDYEYERRGVRNLFMFFEPKASWRHVDLRERRTACDFAQQMRKLADEHYPEAEKIRVVLDNLNTHTPAARSTRHSSHKRPGASSDAWSSITRPCSRFLAKPSRDRVLGAAL
jgi:hypothetical protein